MANKRRFKGGEIPTSSMADIAFLLLIFFLVTTTIDTDKGLGIILPPPGDMEIEIRKENYKTINDKIVITNQNKVSQRDYILELIEAKIKISVKINNKPIVITAGLEKPDTASEGVKYPNPKKQDSIISAVTSMLKYSLIKRKKPKNKMAITIIISIFIYILLINY